MVLPPNKRRKAPKTAWIRCPSRFFTIPPAATSCTHLPLQGRQKELIYFIRRALATLSTVYIIFIKLLTIGLPDYNIKA